MRTIEKSEEFLLNCIRNGLAHSYNCATNMWVKPYPEATGYLLSYFSRNDKTPDKIIEAANTLVKIQHSSGGYGNFFSENLYTFDTAQILLGMLDLYKVTSEKSYLNCAKKCGDFLLSMQLDNGAFYPIWINGNRYVNTRGNWGDNFSYIQVKNIEALKAMSIVTSDSRYSKAVDRLKDWGLRNCDMTYTHPGAYCLEGLLAANEIEFVKHKLESILTRVQNNGFVSYSIDLDYAYVSGSVQCAILLSKTGLVQEAKVILDWARKVQNNHDSGGLFQYANFDGTLNRKIHTEINSWGTKYFAELEKLNL